MTDTPADITSAASEVSASVNAAEAAFDKAFETESAKPEAAVASPAPVVEGSETAKPAESPSAPETTPPVTTEPDEWAKWVAKHNGDEIAAKRSVWETNNRAAQATREKEELAAKLAAYEKAASPAAPEAPKPAPQELPIELKRYDEKIRAVETTFKTTQEERQKYAVYLPTLEQEIRTLNRQIATPNLNVDKDELVTKLTEKINERDAVVWQIGQYDKDLRTFDEKWQELKENREIRAAILEQRKELEAAREAKARSDEERETAQYVEQFQKDWNSTIDRVAKDEKVIPGELSADFASYVRKMGKAYVADGSPIEDVAKFVNDCANEFMGGAKKFHTAQSRLYAAQKKADEKVESHTGADAFASETKRPKSEWTKEQWAAHIDSMPF